MQSDNRKIPWIKRLLGRNPGLERLRVQTLVVAPHNIREALTHPPRAFDFLRIDVSQNCNLFCTYCEIGRNKDMMDAALLREFLSTKVASVENIYFGCAMEPTINRNLAAHILSARELADPPGRLGIQTNGTLLHRHDLGQFHAAGLNTISLSIDSIRPDTMTELRDGTDVAQVLRNVETLRREIPSLRIEFSVVVSKRNYDEIVELIEFASGFGAQEVWLREITFQYAEVTPERQALRLEPGEFEVLKDRVRQLGSRIPVFFLDDSTIVEIDKATRSAVTGS
jgi:molybdenum cofactor biosynthesis enzyme MoaA